MKVILLQDVANLGRKFEVVNVPDGFALNKLIPKNQALMASPDNIKRLTAKRDMQNKIAVGKLAEFQSALKELSGKVVTIKAKMNEQGHLFQTLKVNQIVDALADLGVKLDIDGLSLRESIKEAGLTEVTLVSGKTEEKLKIEIIAI